MLVYQRVPHAGRMSLTYFEAVVVYGWRLAWCFDVFWLVRWQRQVALVSAYEPKRLAYLRHEAK